MRKNLTAEGFTLIETMIAITILSLAIAGPLFTADRAVVAAELSQDQLTASSLAQEGVEYVRWMRDDAYLNAYKTGGQSISTDAWNDFIAGSSARSITQCEASTCTLDPTQNMGTGPGYALQTCSGASCEPLYLQPNGIYTQQTTSGNTKTIYTRTIQVTKISSTEARVASTVTWYSHGTMYTVAVNDTLTAWQ